MPDADMRKTAHPLLDGFFFMFVLQPIPVALLRSFLAFGVLWLGLFPALAHAQQPVIQSIDPTQIEREEPERDANDFPHWISQSDCLADDVLTFRIQVQNPSADNFEVWAGTADCSSATERQGDQANCWRVFRDQVTTSPAAIPIRAQDVVAQNGPATGNNGAPGTEQDCRDRKYINVGLYFMYVNDAGQVASNVITFSDTGIDLKGPIPPSVGRAVAADDALVLRWENTDPSEFRGYRLYCEPVAAEVESSDLAQRSIALDGPLLNQLTSDAGGEDTGTLPSLSDAAVEGDDTGTANTGANVDSGIPSAGGDDGTSGTPTSGAPSCGGASLTAGQPPPSTAVRCGTVDSYSANSGYAEGLTNGQRYAVAVTAVDRLGNESDVSNVVCGTPREVFTFYEDYRTTGGGGGGGICSVRVHNNSPRFPLWLAAAIVVGMALRRRFVDNTDRLGSFPDRGGSGAVHLQTGRRNAAVVLRSVLRRRRRMQ